MLKELAHAIFPENQRDHQLLHRLRTVNSQNIPSPRKLAGPA
jgi:hypothetical protein